MTYTIYWEQIRPVDDAVWDTFVKRALRLIKRRRTGEVEFQTANRKDVFQFKGAEGHSYYTFSVCKNKLRDEMGNCSTNSEPYTMDVFVCLILMFDMGMVKGISSTDMKLMYPEALAYVK